MDCDIRAHNFNVNVMTIAENYVFLLSEAESSKLYDPKSCD